MVPSKIKETFFLRFAVCSANTELKHIEFAWNAITKHVQ